MAQSAERESIPGGSWSCGRVREHGHEDDGRGDGVDVDGGDLIGESSTAGKLRRRGKRAFVRIYIYIYVHAGGALVCQQRRLTPRCTRVLRAEECYDAGPAYHQTDPLRSRPLVAQSSNGASASQVQFPDNSLSRPSSSCRLHPPHSPCALRTQTPSHPDRCSTPICQRPAMTFPHVTQ
jgi:hypothetical protein